MVGKIDRSPLLRQVTPGVEQAEELVEAGGGGLHRVEQLAELLHRLEEVRQQEHERDDGAERHLALVHEPSTDADDRRGRGDAGELDEREVPHRDAHRLHVRVVERAVALGESVTHCLLTPERLDDAHAGDALLERREVVADAITDGEVRLVGVALELDRRDRHDRHRDEAHQRELPRHHHEQRERDRQEQAVRDELQQSELHQLGHRVDV